MALAARKHTYDSPFQSPLSIPPFPNKGFPPYMLVDFSRTSADTLCRIADDTDRPIVDISVFWL
jgi:hypothetical protein